MTQPTISELKEGAQFEGFFAVREANLLSTSAGKPYIRLRIGDATGDVQGNMWDGTPDLFGTFTTGDVIKIRGLAETYRGALQIKVGNLRLAHESEYDPGAFLPMTPANLEDLKAELAQTVASLRDPDYQALAKAFFDDPELTERFARAPAAKENHHAYIGGLLEHTLSMVRIADAICATSTTPLTRDLLILGVLLHDIGKIEELSARTSIEYTDIGKLVGHLVIGTMMIEARALRLENFPTEKKWLAMHLVLSHHGKREYGSPVVPATPEALALHHIDNLDAKTVAARRLIDADNANDRPWTDRSWMLETQLYKRSLTGEATSAPPPTPAPPSDASPKPQPAKKSDLATGSLF